jgi:hypothetical protein
MSFAVGFVVALLLAMLAANGLFGSNLQGAFRGGSPASFKVAPAAVNTVPGPNPTKPTGEQPTEAPPAPTGPSGS